MRRHAYDANGNLTMDLNKGITSISYNTLNLPKRVDFGDMSHIDYTYSADGTKLRTEHFVNGQDTVSTDYCGSLIYEDGARKRLLTDVGYVTGLNTTPLYHYYLKDHQGNNRVVVNQNGDVDEENSYYPFGGFYTYYESQRNVQPYKYNGKELDGRKNLNLYDYGARFYDPALGRFTSVDNYAEKYYPMTPYQYGANNPVKNIDVDGDSIVVSIPEKVNGQLQNVNYYYGLDEKGNSSFISKSGKTSSYTFITYLTQALDELMKGQTGKQLVQDLSLSTKTVYIRQNKRNMADPDGRYVDWNETKLKGGINQKGKTDRPIFVSLGHELAHIQDSWAKTIDRSYWFDTIRNAEKYASHIENKIRAEHKIPLRTHYLEVNGRGDPRSALLIKGTRASLHYKTSVRLGNTVIPTTPYVY